MDSDKSFLLKDAMRQLDWQNQKNAMVIEYSSLIKNETWFFVDSLHNRKVISGQQVFKLKKNRKRKTLKYKAKQIVHGYKQ